MKMAQHDKVNLTILQMVDSKRPTRAATTVQWTLLSCIALCSVDLFGSVVEHGLILDFHDDGG